MPLTPKAPTIPSMSNISSLQPALQPQVKDKLLVNGQTKTTPVVPDLNFGPVGYLNGYADKDDGTPSTLIEQQLKSRGFKVDTKKLTDSGRSSSPPKLKHFLDQDSNNFRFGDVMMPGFYELEDPTFLGYDIFIDNVGSPLFNKQIKNFAKEFGNSVGITEIKNRFYNDKGDALYDIFYRKFFEIFHKLTDSSDTNGNLSPNIPTQIYRSYYINKIAGMKLLHKPFIEYMKDKITITLNEDLKMRALNLSELYRNLTYSFKNGKQLIPRNLLRFNMIIKVSDIRKFKYLDNTDNSIKNQANWTMNPTGDVYKSQWESTSVYYTLYDCHLDFMLSNNTPEDMAIAGYGQGVNATPASLDFEIYFKSVGITMKSPTESVMGFDETSSRESAPYGSSETHPSYISDNMSVDLKTYPLDNILESENKSKVILSKTKTVNGSNQLNPFGELVNGAVKIGTGVIKGVAGAIVNNIEEERKKLLGVLTSEIASFIDLRAKLRKEELKHMGNVYTGDFRDECLKRELEGKGMSAKCFVNKVKNDVLGSFVSSITESENLTIGTLDSITTVSKLSKTFGIP